MPATHSHPPVPSIFASGKVILEATDPADLYAQCYKQLLPPHPSETAVIQRRPLPAPSASSPLRINPHKISLDKPKIAITLRPLEEIGRYTPSTPKGHTRTASRASKRARQPLPNIEEVPDLDSDTETSSSHSRSSSNVSDGSDFALPLCAIGVAKADSRMNRREATAKPSMERTSWMIGDELPRNEGRTGNKDLVEHINYVISAWQRIIE